MNTKLNSKFETIFSSYGIVGWLPDIENWAKVIQKQLTKGGRFILVDFHPTLWMFDDDFKKVSYSYFNDEPYIEIEKGSYANRDNDQETKSIWWSHSLSEITSAFLDQGLKMTTFKEFNYSPYDCFKNTEVYLPNRYPITSYDELLNYYGSQNTPYYCVGIMLYNKNGVRTKIRNPNYEIIRKLSR